MGDEEASDTQSSKDLTLDLIQPRSELWRKPCGFALSCTTETKRCRSVFKPCKRLNSRVFPGAEQGLCPQLVSVFTEAEGGTLAWLREAIACVAS